MKPARSLRPLSAPIHWQQLAHGEWLKMRIEQEIAGWWEQVFGYYLVKFGALSSSLDSSGCRIRRQLSVGEHGAVDIRGKLDELPFLQHSVDACLLTFTLDFANDPHAVMREANRILVPDGHMMIICFNPFSLVGLGQYWPGRRNRYPWHGRFFACHRIKDWLSLLGCEIIAEQHCIFSSLTRSNLSSVRLQQLGERFLPMMNSVYMLLAKKREVPATLIKQSWRLPVRLKPGQVLSGARKEQGK